MTTSLYYQEYEGLDPWGNAVRILPSSLVGIFAAVRPHSSLLLRWLTVDEFWG